MRARASTATILATIMFWIVGGVVAFASVDQSTRPVERNATTDRPDRATIVTASQSAFAPRQSLRPLGRLQPTRQVETQVTQNNTITFEPVLETMVSPRPRARPFTVRRQSTQAIQTTQTQAEAKPKRRGLGALFGGGRKNRVEQGAQGSVCQDSSIKGKTIAPIAGKLSGCGLQNGVRITSVDGVSLTQPASIDCNTARALKTWVRDGVKPAIGRQGGGVKSLRVVAHYSCRTRNNRKGAKISEHGKGRAIDIAAINLNDGSSITVLEGWKNRRDRKTLKKMHKAACGPFGTVLGPEADRYHQDHFHFDTARHRSGSYCR